MRQHIKTLHHHPKRVITISLIIALIIGALGYIEISRSRSFVVDQSNINLNTNENPASPHKLTLGFLASGRIQTVSVKAGDSVKKDQVLATLDAGNALGSLAQAKAAYAIAQANYQKVINGATGPNIDVAKAAVNTAKVNLTEITKQQEVLVSNAYKALLNSSPQAIAVSDFGANNPPIVSGAYGCKDEGAYNLTTYVSATGVSISFSGLEQGSILVTGVPRPMGNCGLFLSFDNSKGNLISGAQFNIEIPNKSAANYNVNNNAYTLALQNKEQSIATAQSAFSQASSALAALVASARPEDVATAQAQVESASGALKIAQAAYNNTIIIAPADGTVTSVAITPGQIATTNAPAIEFISNNSTN